jgi:hypothetical protein
MNKREMNKQKRARAQDILSLLSKHIPSMRGHLALRGSQKS